MIIVFGFIWMLILWILWEFQEKSDHKDQNIYMTLFYIVIVIGVVVYMVYGGYEDCSGSGC